MVQHSAEKKLDIYPYRDVCVCVSSLVGLGTTTGKDRQTLQNQPYGQRWILRVNPKLLPLFGGTY